MEELKITDADRRGYHSFMKDDDFEYKNPIEKASEVFIKGFTTSICNHLLFLKEHNKIPIEANISLNSIEEIERLAKWKSIKLWEEEYNRLMSLKIPATLFKVLESDSKKEQERLLRGFSMTRDELTGFIFKASKEHGFTLSRYKSEHQHKGINATQLPTVAYKKEDNSIFSYGETSLTEGEIKHAIDNRKVVVSRFLDKGSIWHCFFLTFRGLKGEETGGKSHLHFVSHAWGHSREYVLGQLKSDNYKLGTLPHINYTK